MGESSRSLRRIFVLAAMALACLAVVSEAAAMPPTPESAEVVYTEVHRIASINADGAGYKALTRPDVVPQNGNGSYNGDFGPEISPDGQRLLFWQLDMKARKTDRIMVADRDAGNARPIFAVRGIQKKKYVSIHSPTWSSDGRRIFFVLEIDKELKNLREHRLYLVISVKPDGSGRQVHFRRFVDGTRNGYPKGIGSLDSAVQSPDGRRMLLSGFSYGRLDSGIWMLNLRTGMTRFLHRGENPGWSPDGSEIAFDSEFEGLGSRRGGNHGETAYDSRIYVMDADGSDVRRLVKGYGDGVELSPDWSPDGSRILFTSDRATYDDSYQSISEIYTINVDGSCLSRITFAGRETFEPDWGPEADRSPDPTSCE